MPVKYWFIAIFILNSAIVHSQNKENTIDTTNYVDYYKNINRAETLFFMKGEVDSSLALYDKVFKNYDFVYVTDLMEAAQIAIYSHRPYKKYLKQGFRFGLQFTHLKKYPLFKNKLSLFQKDKDFQENYKINRKKYLEKIDYDYLHWLYNLFLKDQVDKTKRDYAKIVRRNLSFLKKKIQEKGFPGEWILGVYDPNIFIEKGIPQWDLIELKRDFKRLKSRDDIGNEKTILFQDKAFPLLIHYPCSYEKLKYLLWDEVLKGHLHPRDLGTLYDNCHHKNYFRLNIFTHYPKETKENLIKTDSLRKSFYIVPIELDKKKEEFQNKNGFILFRRYWEPFKIYERAKP